MSDKNKFEVGTRVKSLKHKVEGEIVRFVPGITEQHAPFYVVQLDNEETRHLLESELKTV